MLLTGFEPFLDYPTNPTAVIAEELDGTRIGDYDVVARVLPVDYSTSGQRLEEHLENIQPEALVSVGLAAGRQHITPERIAVNCNDGPADNTGRVPAGEKIDPTGPDGIFSRLPIGGMVARLRQAQLPAEISNTAGLYLCNHVMYRGLRSFQQTGNTGPCGFIHVPASHDLAVRHGNLPSWSQADLTTAIRVCLETLSDPESAAHPASGSGAAW